MQSLNRVVLNKGTITQSFDESAAAYLESKGWKRVAKAKAKPAKSRSTKSEDK